MNTNGLQPEKLEAFFGEQGPLASVIDSYESRPEQIRVAQEVGKAIERGNDLIAEAGTGTGKTLAYLVPALASGLEWCSPREPETFKNKSWNEKFLFSKKLLGTPSTCKS